MKGFCPKIKQECECQIFRHTSSRTTDEISCITYHTDYYFCMTAALWVICPASGDRWNQYFRDNIVRAASKIEQRIYWVSTIFWKVCISLEKWHELLFFRLIIFSRTDEVSWSLGVLRTPWYLSFKYLHISFRGNDICIAIGWYFMSCGHMAATS